MEPNEQLPIAARPETLRAAGIIALILTLIVGIFFALEYSPSSAPAAQPAAVVTVDPFTDILLHAKAAIVIDIQTGEVLYERKPDMQLPLASLTKVVLALAVSEVLAPDDVLVVTADTPPSNSAERLKQGERWRVQDIIDYTLIASSNAGAVMLANAANTKLHARYPQSPDDATTLWRMNGIAQELGLSQTYFLNVSGLDLSPTQSGSYGSARDMAKLFAYAASANPALFAATARANTELTSAAGGRLAAASNTNDAQGAILGLVMGKTGLTDLAGGNLAVVFDVGLAHPVVAVVLGSTEKGRFDDMEKIVTAARASITAQ